MKKKSSTEKIFENLRFRLEIWIKALRVHQWTKNVLIFVPIITAQLINDSQSWILAAYAFIAFSITASSVYVLNDIIDLTDDRKHPSKKFRPFASGDIPILHGIISIPILLSIAGLICTTLPLVFTKVLIGYCILSYAYSFILKRFVLVDVFVLASLYTWRLLAGTLVLQIHYSLWLFSFSVFLFLSLAMVKRVTELIEITSKLGKNYLSGRDYQSNDIDVLTVMGVAAGYTSILIFSLYIQGEAHRFSQPTILWLSGLSLLFWISRIWLITHRGQMHSDPIVFAIRDMLSFLVLIFCGLCFVIATYA